MSPVKYFPNLCIKNGIAVFRVQAGVDEVGLISVTYICLEQ